MKRLTTLSLLPLVTLVAACGSMPEHSNTLVFATSTKTAIDISQEPSGALGLTLGYKRLEAVWMPLLPNKGKKGEREGVDCDTRDKTACPMFTGSDGTVHDTYSVLATFSGQVSGSGGAAAGGADTVPSAKAGGSIVQFFATGVAAQKLAGAQGNAALFNTAAVTPELTPEEKADLLQGMASNAGDVARLMTKLEDKSNPQKLNKAQVDKLVAAAAQANPPLPAGHRQAITNLGTGPSADLETYLKRHWPTVKAPLSTAATQL